MVRLGSSGGDMRELTADAIDRGVAALDRFRQVAEVHDAPITAVATSRGAGGREPRRPHRPGVGGGRRPRQRHLRVGGGPPHPPGRAAGRAGLRQPAAAVRHRRREHRAARRAAGRGAASRCASSSAPSASPAASSTGRLAPGRRRRLPSPRALDAGPVRARDPPARHRGARSARRARSARWREMAAVPATGTPAAVGQQPHPHRRRARRGGEASSSPRPPREARAELPGLDAGRADIILAGALILEQVVARARHRRAGRLRLRAARGRAARHLAAARTAGRSTTCPTSGARASLHLAELMDEDPPHSAQVARLALELFDATADRHGLGDDAREILEAAALLCNVGMFLSPRAAPQAQLLRHPQHRSAGRLHRPRGRAASRSSPATTARRRRRPSTPSSPRSTDDDQREVRHARRPPPRRHRPRPQPRGPRPLGGREGQGRRGSSCGPRRSRARTSASSSTRRAPDGTCSRWPSAWRSRCGEAD